ncbi:MAG: cohesin domain-containing protein [Patescibacteria group bacterium]
MATFKKIVSVFLLVFWFAPAVSLAARLYTATEKSTITSNNQFLVDVYVDSDQSVNALSGYLEFSKEILRVVDIFEGDSIINFWIERPRQGTPGVVNFSGITPGGFTGTKHKVFSIVFEAAYPGQAVVKFSDSTALANDGLGSQLPTEVAALSLSILPSDGTSIQKMMRDENPPEPFKASIESDPNIFEGRYFLVFSTEDKGTGISHYEIREGLRGTFKRAESPYLLEDQSLTKTISLKAIDKAGNEQLIVIEKGESVSSVWEEYGWFAIMALIVMVMTLLLFIFKRR